ncbi:MAG: ORF6N domain-containing protein [Bacilli bacterium]|nr:ORF6N domain-containing protein [Bacilli bacterium]
MIEENKMKNEIMEKEIINIKDMIYELDGKEIMLDSDLAKLYNVETKRINEAVRNNPEKFPKRFYYRISEDEYNDLKSKFSTSRLENQYGGSRKGHTAFTEQGIYMLATILKSKEAIQTSIAIMDTFVKMRHYINYTKSFLPYKFLILEDKVDNNTKRIDELFDKFNPKDIVKDYIYFEGDFYDSYSTLLDIFNRSKKEIIIIDNYAGKELLDILKKVNRKIIIVSKNIDEILKKKYEKQYKNVTFINNNTFHDRFIILDRYILYSCGTSLKDIGKKCFTINEMYERRYVDIILDEIFESKKRDN